MLENAVNGTKAANNFTALRKRPRSAKPVIKRGAMCIEHARKVEADKAVIRIERISQSLVFRTSRVMDSERLQGLIENVPEVNPSTSKADVRRQKPCINTFENFFQNNGINWTIFIFDAVMRRIDIDTNRIERSLLSALSVKGHTICAITSLEPPRENECGLIANRRKKELDVGKRIACVKLIRLLAIVMKV